MPQRYALIIEYDGTNYVGWQSQKDCISVQSILEEALFGFLEKETKTYVAGRTDAGVHAYGQVVHCDIEKDLSEDNIILATNYHLKDHPIRVVGCYRVSDDFNARFSALKKRYVYRVINRRASLSLDKNRAWHVKKKLDFDHLYQACQFYIGHHDFTSFRASECQAKSPLRTLDFATVIQNGEEIKFTFEARSFLHHQVRNMVGTAVDIAKGKWSPDYVGKLFTLKDRTLSGQTAPAHGLYLEKIWYDEI